MASLQIFGILPVSHVLFTRRSSASFPLGPRFINISLCTLSGPGDFLFLSFLNCFYNSARVNSLIKLLSSGSVARFDLSIFSSPLSRSVFFPDLLTSAKTLLECSAFLKSVVSVSFSKCRGFGFSFRFSPDRLFSKDQASLPPCFRLSCAHVFDQVSCLDFLVISFASADF